MIFVMVAPVFAGALVFILVRRHGRVDSIASHARAIAALRAITERAPSVVEPMRAEDRPAGLRVLAAAPTGPHSRPRRAGGGQRGRDGAARRRVGRHEFEDLKRADRPTVATLPTVSARPPSLPPASPDQLARVAASQHLTPIGPPMSPEDSDAVLAGTR